MRFSSPRRFALLSGGLGALTLLVLTLSVSIGAVAIDPATVWQVVAGHLGFPVAATDAITDQIVWSVRVPRALLGLVVGVGLAVSGVVIQAVVRNPLGDPYLIGIVPGAGLGAVSVIVLGSGALAGLSLSLAAFIGGMVAFLVIFAIGRSNGRWPATRLVLSGVAIGYLISSLTYFLQTVATPNQVQRVLFWSLGSLGGAEWDDLGIPVLVILVGTIWLLAHGARLNALATGADLAGALGLNVGRFQFQLMAVVALVSGAIVAVAGGIGFLGLMAPHLARLLVGAEHRRVLITSALVGGLFLPLADIAARMVRAPAELPIGIITAAIGAPFFLWMLLRTGRATR